MRLFLGMILGALLTVAIAYYSDTVRTSTVAAGAAANSQRTMVNWDVVAENWNSLKARARESFDKLALSIDRG